MIRNQDQLDQTARLDGQADGQAERLDGQAECLDGQAERLDQPITREDRPGSRDHPTVPVDRIAVVRGDGLIEHRTTRPMPEAIQGEFDPNHLLTTFQAKDMLQITYPTLIRWFKKGWINYIEYPNKRKFVPLSEIHRVWTEGQRRDR